MFYGKWQPTPITNKSHNILSRKRYSSLSFARARGATEKDRVVRPKDKRSRINVLRQTSRLSVPFFHNHTAPHKYDQEDDNTLYLCPADSVCSFEQCFLVPRIHRAINKRKASQHLVHNGQQAHGRVDILRRQGF